METFLTVCKILLTILFIAFPFATGAMAFVLPRVWKARRQKTAPRFSVIATVVEKGYHEGRKDNRGYYRILLEIAVTRGKVVVADDNLYNRVKVGDRGVLFMKGEDVLRFLPDANV